MIFSAKSISKAAAHSGKDTLDVPRGTSLGTRFIALTGTMILLSSLVGVSYTVFDEIRRAKDELLIHGQRVAGILAQNSEWAIYTRSDDSLDQIVDGVAGDPDIAYVGVLDRNHRVLRSRVNSSGLDLGTIPHEISMMGGGWESAKTIVGGDGHSYISLLVPVVANSSASDDSVITDASATAEGETIGYIHLGLSQQRLHSRVRAVLLSTTLFSSVLILVGIALTVILVRRIVAPIGEFSAATREIAEGRFESAVTATGGREIAELAHSFNTMAENLGVSKCEVEHSTAALTASNRRLKKEVADRLSIENDLRIREERYRLLFERNLAGVYRATVDGRLLDCNLSFARYHGYDSPQEALPDLPPCHYDTSESWERYLSELRESGSLLNAEFQCRKKDGTMFWVSSNTSLVADENGELTLIEGTMFDITDRKELEKKRQLHSQKVEAVGRLAGGVAHDFNNILQASLAIVEGLQQRAGEDGEIPEDKTTELRELIMRGSQLTNQLLVFSRRDTPKSEDVEVNNVIHGLSRMLRRLVPENIGFDLDLTEEPLWVTADRGRLEQVLANLVVNAADAMLGGGQLTIRTSRNGTSHLTLTVADTGIGIPREYREQIFDPYFTTKDAGRGTGLGLSVVHGIVTDYGGTIEVESQVNRGTSISIELPVRPVQKHALPASNPSLRKKPPTGDNQRILLVEDEESARRNLEELLGLIGYTVVAVGSAEEAERLATEPSFDLLLTDQVLPGRSGAELAKKLRAAQPGLPVILMSGYVADTLVRQGVMRGEMRFLQKPFDLDAIANEIHQALDG